MNLFNLLTAPPTRVESNYRVTEAPAGNKSPGLRRFEVTAQYPETGCCHNAQCALHAFLLEGSVTLQTAEGKVLLTPGDVVEIPVNMKHAWIPTPGEKAVLLTAAFPAWYETQHIHNQSWGE